MSKELEFLRKAEVVLNSRVGGIVARSLLKTNLAKIHKDATALTAEDRKVLVEHIVKAAALFETKDESKLIASDLESLLETAE